MELASGTSSQQAAPVAAAGSIERRSNLSREEFTREYLLPHKPVIITDALRHWKAIDKWTPEYLRDRAGEHEFVVDGKTWKLKDLVAAVRESSAANPAPYLRNQPVQNLGAEWLADISPMPDYARPNWLETKFFPGKVHQRLGRAVIADFFLGGAGRSFPCLHYDLLNSHAFLGEIYGHKMYTMYSPDQTPFLYAKSDNPIESTVNLQNPDLSRHPLFEKARAIQGVLNPGEMIFIPARWWHTAKNLDAAITISINVVNASNWNGLVKDQYEWSQRSKYRAIRLSALPYAAYLRGVGLYRSIVG
ncbi:MAG: cupin-like domain-containing protein [Candidatus Acidiferrales bacterium]